MNPRDGAFPDEIFDLALQEVLGGTPLEEVLARHPRAAELEPLLRVALSMKEAPHPEMPASSLATVLARAQAQAAADRRKLAAPAPVIAGVVEASRPVVQPRAAIAPAGEVRRGWLSRLSAMLAPAAPALRLAALAAVLIVVVAGMLAYSRGPRQPDSIPAATGRVVPFSIEGRIDEVHADRWVLDGLTVYLQVDTQITGVATVGADARIEGDMMADGRRVALKAVITAPISAATANPEPSSTPPLAGKGATAVPITPAPAEAGIARTPTLGAVPPASRPTTRTARPTEARPTGTPIPPTRVVPATATVHVSHTPEPTHTPRPLPTNTPVIEPSHTPEPEPTETAQVEETATPRPEVTPTEEPTSEPEETQTAEPSSSPTPVGTATVEPTHEPEETGTPQPTQGPGSTPQPSPTETF